MRLFSMMTGPALALMPADSALTDLPDPITMSPRRVTSGALISITLPSPPASMVTSPRPTRMMGLVIRSVPSYTPGVGSTTPPGVASSMRRWISDAGAPAVCGTARARVIEMAIRSGRMSCLL